MRIADPAMTPRGLPVAASPDACVVVVIGEVVVTGEVVVETGMVVVEGGDTLSQSRTIALVCEYACDHQRQPRLQVTIAGSDPYESSVVFEIAVIACDAKFATGIQATGPD